MPNRNFKSLLLKIEDLDIPVRVFKENRGNIRASLNKNYASLRLPKSLSKRAEQEQIDRFYDWLKNKVLIKDRFRNQFKAKQYRQGYLFSLFDRSFKLFFENSKNKNHSAKLIEPGIIKVKLANEQQIENSTDEISHLISRVIANVYLPAVTKRIQSLNKTYFKKDVKSVKLKYNKSNWGSCSSSGNINISTRLLFAPEAVQDYVYIHELAHLVELNHSERYWNIVSSIMPDYKVQENWLKQNGHNCDFGL